MEVAVLDINGKETGRNVDLSDSIFAVEPHNHAIYLDVKQYLANQRQGTHKSKERAEITGSTRKIKKQKGSGTARAGSIKSPLFRGGGRAFGPRPRSYSFKLNKGLKRLARKSALSTKIAENQLFIVEDFNFEAPKTKAYINVLKAFGLAGKRSLLVLNESNKNVYLSARNLQKTRVVTFNELNTYAIMNNQGIIISEGSVKEIENILSK